MKGSQLYEFKRRKKASVRPTSGLGFRLGLEQEWAGQVPPSPSSPSGFAKQEEHYIHISGIVYPKWLGLSGNSNETCKPETSKDTLNSSTVSTYNSL